MSGYIKRQELSQEVKNELDRIGILSDDLDEHKADMATKLANRVLTGVYRIGRDVYNLLESYVSNDAQANGRKIKTNLVYDGRQIMTLHLVGYNFVLREVVSVYISIYNWDTPGMIGTASSVNSYKPEIKIASEDDKLVIWVNEGNRDIRWSLNAYNVNRDNSSGVVPIEQFQNWRVANEIIPPTAKNVTIIPYK